MDNIQTMNLQIFGLYICNHFTLLLLLLVPAQFWVKYSTTQTQVDGLAQMLVLVLTLEYLRTNTYVENVSMRHEHNMTVHATSLNRGAESFASWNLHVHCKMLENFIQFTQKESTQTLKCFACEHQLMSEWYHIVFGIWFFSMTTLY